ncbi:MAG TPA: hypothetical protein VIM56_02880 [Rhizomicrobium sp.]
MQSLVNVLIRYPDDPPATRTHVHVATAIISALFIGRMCCAVDLHDDAGKWTGEVCDVRANRVLAAKAEERPRTRTDARPEHEFCARHALTQIAGALAGFVVAAHDGPLRLTA